MVAKLKSGATDEDLRQFARQWAELLAAENYTVAFDLLLHRRDYPGKSWCTSAEDLRAWVEGYGTNEPSADEPPHKVTSRRTTLNDEPTQSVLRGSSTYPGQLAHLDYWLPLDGEWSDLMASFDFVQCEGELAPVLRALRVP